MSTREAAMSFQSSKADALECSARQLGLEEEVFVTEPLRPSLASLYYLFKLLLKNPRHYYRHSASNFARGIDMKQGLMSSIEIATAPHPDPSALMDDLQQRRRDLIQAVGSAFIVPVGHLFELDAPTNTAGLHLHLEVAESHQQRAYQNLAYFLPLLILASASSPFRAGRYFGPSYRVACSFAIGPLREDPAYRFQDLILARRLKTVEIRALDPVWDLERLRHLVVAAQTIVSLPCLYPLDYARYAELRQQACEQGYTPDLQALYHEMREFVPMPEELLKRTASDELREWVETHGIEPAYRALDNAYRHGALEPVSARPVTGRIWKAVVGLAGYYGMRLPYTLWKAWREWH